MKNIIILLFISIIPLALFADKEKIDSLIKIIRTSKNDTTKINAYNSLFISYEFNDTTKAKQYAFAALELAYKINHIEGKAIAYTHLGFYYEDQGNFNKAIQYYKKSHYEYSELKKSKTSSISLTGEMGIANCYINTGNALRFLADYPLSLDNYQKALKIYENILNSGKTKDTLSLSDKIASCNYNIGNIHFYQDDLDVALRYYKKSLQFYEETNDKSGIGLCYVNMGALMFRLEKDTLSLEYEQKALKILLELGDKNNVTNCYVNIGNIYDKWGNYNLAIENEKKALKLSKELGDKSGVSAVLGNLSVCYLKLKKYNEAIDYAQKSLEIAKETGELQWQKTAYTNLSSAYEELGNIRSSFNYYKLGISIEDSMFNKEKHAQLSEMEAIYQNDKKQKEIELLNKNKILQNKELEKQTFIRNSFVAGFAVVLLFSLIILRNYRQKRKINQLLMIKNNEIEQQKEELITQSEQLIDINSILENKNLLITDSIRYAKQIQDAILPSEELINQNCTESFILFKPKDIVSGDFYWYTATEDYIFVAVVDCTGHGIPGAFMSMIGNTLLNQIVIEKRTYNPEKILKKLDEGVSYSLLKQSNKQQSQDDGMEISLCRIDLKNKELQIACTNQLAFVIKDHDFSDIEINIHSIGGSLSKNKSFRTQKINYNNEAIFYLLTDGFQDQFGGPNNNKFLSKQIKELLLINHKKTLAEQKEILENSLTNWIGFNKQVDDITVLGIKIS